MNVWNAMDTEMDSTVKDANPIIFSRQTKMIKAGYLVSHATVILQVCHTGCPNHRGWSQQVLNEFVLTLETILHFHFKFTCVLI